MFSIQVGLRQICNEDEAKWGKYLVQKGCEPRRLIQNYFTLTRVLMNRRCKDICKDLITEGNKQWISLEKGE